MKLVTIFPSPQTIQGSKPGLGGIVTGLTVGRSMTSTTGDGMLSGDDEGGEGAGDDEVSKTVMEANTKATKR